MREGGNGVNGTKERVKGGGDHANTKETTPF